MSQTQIQEWTIGGANISPLLELITIVVPDYLIHIYIDEYKKYELNQQISKRVCHGGCGVGGNC